MRKLGSVWRMGAMKEVVVLEMRRSRYLSGLSGL